MKFNRICCNCRWLFTINNLSESLGWIPIFLGSCQKYWACMQLKIKIKIKLCRIWGFHSGGYEEYHLLGYDTLQKWNCITVSIVTSITAIWLIVCSELVLWSVYFIFCNSVLWLIAYWLTLMFCLALDHRECGWTTASALWHSRFFLSGLLALPQFSKTLSNGLGCRKR
jgi:hypothetical protein